MQGCLFVPAACLRHQGSLARYFQRRSGNTTSSPVRNNQHAGMAKPLLLRFATSGEKQTIANLSAAPSGRPMPLVCPPCMRQEATFNAPVLRLCCASPISHYRHVYSRHYQRAPIDQGMVGARAPSTGRTAAGNRSLPAVSQRLPCTLQLVVALGYSVAVPIALDAQPLRHRTAHSKPTGTRRWAATEQPRYTTSCCCTLRQRRQRRTLHLTRFARQVQRTLLPLLPLLGGASG